MSDLGDRTIIVLPLVVSLVVVGLFPPAVATGTERTLIFSPWSSTREVMSRVASTGGRIVRFGAAPFIVVVQLPENGKQLHLPGLLATLRTAFGGCGKPSGASL